MSFHLDFGRPCDPHETFFNTVFSNNQLSHAMPGQMSRFLAIFFVLRFSGFFILQYLNLLWAVCFSEYFPFDINIMLEIFRGRKRKIIEKKKQQTRAVEVLILSRQKYTKCNVNANRFSGNCRKTNKRNMSRLLFDSP